MWLRACWFWLGHGSEVVVSSKYEIRVRGRLTRSLAVEFERFDLAVTELPAETVLNGDVEDQSALYGILRQLESLGLELVDLRRLPQSGDGTPSGSRFPVS